MMDKEMEGIEEVLEIELPKQPKNCNSTFLRWKLTQLAFTCQSEQCVKSVQT